MTERRISSKTTLDAADTRSALRLINDEDAKVAAAVRAQIPAIARAVEAAVRAVRGGGRILYVGAGTSGRLGVLDAAECPPTFGIPSKMVQAVIAGGRRALVRAVEAAEDDAAQGRRDLAARKIGPHDIVVGLAASGRTAYTLGALAHARARCATTVAITCHPDSPLARLAGIAIVLRTGPEVLAGSTRMKAALAQKMALHMFSTAVMARLGHVYQNYMIDVRPTNRKLVQRARTILMELTGADPKTAARVLKQARNNVKIAVVMLRRGVSRAKAAALLRQHGGDLRQLEQS